MTEGILIAVAILVTVGVALEAALGAGLVLAHVIKPVVDLFSKYVLGIDSVKTGSEAMVGVIASALAEFTPNEDGTYSGRVIIGGEDWAAQSSIPVRSRQQVEVVEVSGLVLRVKPGKDDDAKSIQSFQPALDPADAQPGRGDPSVSSTAEVGR